MAMEIFSDVTKQAGFMKPSVEDAGDWILDFDNDGWPTF